MYIQTIKNAFYKLGALGIAAVIMLVGITAWVGNDLWQDRQNQEAQVRQQELIQAANQGAAWGVQQLMVNISKEYHETGALNFSPLLLDGNGEPLRDEDGNLRRGEQVKLIKE